MPLIERRNTLLNYCQTKDEQELIRAFFSARSISQEVYLLDLIDVLAKWRWMSGISTSNQDEDSLAKELLIIAQFIAKNYEGMTIDEVSLCIDLSLTNKLDVDVRTFNTFSPMYVSRILNAYVGYKRKQLEDIKERKFRHELEAEAKSEKTKEQKAQDFKDFICYMYDDYKEKGIVNDYFNTIYNFFKRTNRLVIADSEIIEEAKMVAKKMASDKMAKFKQEEFATTNRMFSERDKESWYRSFAKNYCVQKYFEANGIDKMLENVLIDDFS